MALKMTQETEQKLERVALLLKDEFPDTRPGDVTQKVGVVTRNLVAQAKIEDFLPVLVHRYAREQLLENRERALTGDDLAGPDAAMSSPAAGVTDSKP